MFWEFVSYSCISSGFLSFFCSLPSFLSLFAFGFLSSFLSLSSFRSLFVYGFLSSFLSLFAFLFSFSSVSSFSSLYPLDLKQTSHSAREDRTVVPAQNFHFVRELQTVAANPYCYFVYSDFLLFPHTLYPLWNHPLPYFLPYSPAYPFPYFPYWRHLTVRFPYSGNFLRIYLFRHHF